MATPLQTFLEAPIQSYLPPVVRIKRGDLFGIELECEGRNVAYSEAAINLLEFWQPHADGSLRNNHGQSCEWVFNGPVDYKKSLKRIDALFNYFEKRKARLAVSNRTSTHIHFNMGDKSVYQLVNLFILFTVLEDLLDRFCGEDRRGNLFCLSSRHAENQLQWFTDAVCKDFSFRVFQEDFRYCSLNIASLNKFGTVEFRAMRGLDNREDVATWLSVVNELCSFACYSMKSPVTILTDISEKTPIGFVKQVFSEKNFKLLTEGVAEHEVNASLYEGLRLVQMLCYKVGESFEAVKFKGRDFWDTFGDADEEVNEAVEGDIPVGEARKRFRVADPARQQGLRDLDLRAMRLGDDADLAAPF